MAGSCDVDGRVGGIRSVAPAIDVLRNLGAAEPLSLAGFVDGTIIMHSASPYALSGQV